MPLRTFALLLFPALAFAQNDSGDAPVPAVIWKFEDPTEPGLAKAKLDAGPRPPQFPTFAATNKALTLDDKHPSVRIAEDDLPNANMRFGLKDSITIESWVKADPLKEGSYAYIVGKGRNGKKGKDEKNQNYALRLKGDKQGNGRVSFLFSSAATKEAPADWHRWTTNESFTPGAWHHVAVVYTFGDAKSIRGYIDGKPATGTWDMGGATDRAPVTDDDHLMIGTGNGGGANNTFHGQLDDLAVWRSARSETTLASRYQTAPAAPALKRTDVPKGTVLVQLCEDGMPDKNAWPDGQPTATETYREEAFGFFDIPHKYVDTGVRAERAFPMMLRASALIDLPAGKHRLLLRSRGAARLFINDKLVTTTPFPTGDGSGHNSLRKAESYLNLGPDFRFAPPGNREATVEFTSTGGEQLVVLETMVGSYMGKSKRRPELGETVVAISPQGETSWKLLSPTRAVPYTDAGWEAYANERAANLAKLDAAAREAKRKEHEKYWAMRREFAAQVDFELWRKWSIGAVPELPAGYPANNAIDHFLAVKIAEAKAQAASAKGGTVNFHEKILPILEAKCLSCHAGEKAKGGLQLDDRKAVFAGGDSDGAGIVPKEPGKSSILARVKSHEAGSQMPPKGDRLTKEQIGLIETWIAEGAHWPDLKVDHLTVTELASDLAFLRRVYLDTVGVVPTLQEIGEFTRDTSPEKRAKLIDKLLADPRWADHWMGYWQDVLAENPNILNPTLNNTGPFRWWIYESLLDNKPMDLFVTELLRQQGSVRFGGPAGFGIASQNDAPMAAKGTIISTAFLGVEMKCARCHDAPNHKSTQKELFQLAAMLGGKSIKLPVTSSVPLDKLHEGVGRKPLIQVTLKPGTEISAVWPLTRYIDEATAKKLAERPNDTRDVLAAAITSPQNEQFARVMANRLWARLMGRGIVATVDDWERSTPTHPELLKWLGREFVRGNYDMKALARTILNSHAYQRAVDPALKETPVLYTARANRRLAAEQVVDSLFAATGKPWKTEECSLDIDGARDSANSLTLGQPRRSWMLTSTSNERDRPSLALPRIQAVTDVLAAFGWRGSRQDPVTLREASANVLQPAILQNGIMATWLTRLSDDHGFTEVALKAKSPEALIDDMFLRILTRKPTKEERTAYSEYLKEGFDQRQTPPAMPFAADPPARKPEPYVSWSNHLDPQATVVRQQQEDAARAGDPPTTRLREAWRTRLEDVLWAVLNSPEFVFTP